MFPSTQFIFLNQTQILCSMLYVYRLRHRAAYARMLRTSMSQVFVSAMLLLQSQEYKVLYTSGIEW
jgi:hypothetical protein